MGSHCIACMELWDSTWESPLRPFRGVMRGHVGSQAGGSMFTRFLGKFSSLFLCTRAHCGGRKTALQRRQGIATDEGQEEAKCFFLGGGGPQGQRERIWKKRRELPSWHAGALRCIPEQRWWQLRQDAE